MKKLTVLLILLLMVGSIFTISLVNAGTFSSVDSEEEIKAIDTSEYLNGGLWGRVITWFRDLGLFTTMEDYLLRDSVYVTELNCGKSVVEKDKIFVNKASLTYPAYAIWYNTDSSDPATYVCVYYGKPEGPNEISYCKYVGIGAKSTESFACLAGSYWDNMCFARVYGCDSPCSSDSQCSAEKFCSMASSINIYLPGYGACKDIGPCDATYCNDNNACTEDVCKIEGRQRVCYYYAMLGCTETVATCKDECTAGRVCASTTSYKNCGNYDTDSCLEWSNIVKCSTGQTCSNGVCVGETTPTPTPTNLCGDKVCDAGECTLCPGDCPTPCIPCTSVSQCNDNDLTTEDRCVNKAYCEWVAEEELCEIRNTDADTNCDEEISNGELQVYITKWKNGEVDRFALGTVLQAWSAQ
jgi:hypothetical protein